MRHGLGRDRRRSKTGFAIPPSTVFASFPWPYPIINDQRERIAGLSQRIIEQRQQICTENDFGLTTLYNAVDEGAYTDLKALHAELYEAVAVAYGWPKMVAHNGDEIVQRLLEINREIAVGMRGYDPFGTHAAGGAAMLPLPD
jgi:hypothetical protein